MTTQWAYPGARWWKFDFHTHTPASKDTDAWQRVIGTPDELKPEKWLLRYMAAGIDCVAVTDHNSGAWVDKLKTAYAAMQVDPPEGFRELHLFPGVEISANGGFHLLAIFDTSATTSDIDSLLGRVDYTGTKGNSDGVTRRSAADVVQAVLDAGALPIPAHADAIKGLLQLKVDGALQSVIDHHTLGQVLSNSGVLAMEVLARETPKPSAYTQAKLSWAEVIGSDCHTFQGPAVPGSRYTWIKMAKPSLEGLRLSLLDGQGISVRRSDDAESFSPFDKPEHFIEAIEISDARFMGRGNRPARLEFNPYFNALVGGRGTGKSTVVHALRLAYRRERELGTDGEASETFARFNKIARNRNDWGGLLATTHFVLTVSRDDVRHRLLWQQDGQGQVVEEWDEASAQWKASASQAITEQRFPVRLFSQGQIAALAGESQQSLLQVIDEAAGTDTAQDTFEEAKRSFFATCAKLRELDGKLKGRDALNLNLQDVQRKLARFEAAHHAEVLKAYQRTSRQAREMDRQFDSVAAISSRLRGLAGDLLAEDTPDSLFEPSIDAEPIDVLRQLAQSITEAKAQIEAVAQQLVDKGTALREQLSQGVWQAQIEHSKVAYETLKADLLAQGVSDPSEYGRLVQERQRLDTEVARLDALQKQFEELKTQARTQLDYVLQARRAISTTRTQFLEQTLAENHFVRMRLIPYGRDAQGIERSLRDLLGTSDKFKDDIYIEAQDDIPAKGLIADLLLAADLSDQPGEPGTPQFEESIKQLQKRLTAACRGSGDLGGRFNKYLVAETEKRPELINHVLCWFPEDGLQVEYSRKGDGRDFQSIGQASAGQRAAAMLAFLLAHGDEPLVLDQPEDDLDNHLIYDLVVQQIRANKQRRQLIIVTHNPNIVVNGDAEMIHALDFKHQCFVSKSGSLQNKDMREEVCKVMEGGKDAFERRYQRLGREI
ncbi:chromosome segregation protein SMC [Pseudomonas indoloxydans]|uniref:Chromosome segregation protein SMC n=1 Tax=Ectopseudomonas oleovorans TaxID=301 RepID=A0A2T5PLT7_ECTOL|nr:AAA family ATPase [Pseudomonas indoloxydans]PTU78713.1 chromosome segregation protein SMC [Pseudomonas indoloxydans]